MIQDDIVSPWRDLPPSAEPKGTRRLEEDPRHALATSRQGRFRSRIAAEPSPKDRSGLCPYIPSVVFARHHEPRMTDSIQSRWFTEDRLALRASRALPQIANGPSPEATGTNKFLSASPPASCEQTHRRPNSPGARETPGAPSTARCLPGLYATAPTERRGKKEGGCRIPSSAPSKG